jgi:hypothetical protein
VYAVAASPVGQLALELASEGPRTKGPIAVFGVLLMFTMLAGGVFMLLQSSFGVKVGYLMTGTAFFGCWLVLSLLWLTGVPGLPLPGLPRWGIPEIQRSTPQYTGPQGEESSWQLIDTPEENKHAIPENAELIAADPKDLTDQNLTAEITAAQTAGAEGIAAFYAKATGTDAALILPDSTYVIEKTEFVRRDKKARWVRLSTAPAKPNASASPETLALIDKIEPTTFDLYFLEGDLANQTYYAVGIFTLLFVLHAGLLARTERKPTAQPQGAPERLVNA